MATYAKYAVPVEIIVAIRLGSVMSYAAALPSEERRAMTVAGMS